MKQPLEEQITVIWKKVDEAQKRSIEAKALAQHLNKNVVEAFLMAQQALKNSEMALKQLENYQGRIENRLTEMRSDIKKYTYWGFGLFTTFVSLILAIKFLS